MGEWAGMDRTGMRGWDGCRGSHWGATTARHDLLSHCLVLPAVHCSLRGSCSSQLCLIAVWPPHANTHSLTHTHTHAHIMEFSVQHESTAPTCSSGEVETPKTETKKQMSVPHTYSHAFFRHPELTYRKQILSINPMTVNTQLCAVVISWNPRGLVWDHCSDVKICWVLKSFTQTNIITAYNLCSLLVYFNSL